MPECKSITKVILPAIRASVAEVLNKTYKYTESDIADRLSVAQPAVSKYLSNNCSEDILKLKSRILSSGMADKLIAAIAGGRPRAEVEKEIDWLCGKLALEAEIKA